MHGSLSDNSTQATVAAPVMQPAINAARRVIIVRAPIDRVYQQWSRIEELPIW